MMKEGMLIHVLHEVNKESTREREATRNGQMRKRTKIKESSYFTVCQKAFYSVIQALVSFLSLTRTQ